MWFSNILKNYSNLIYFHPEWPQSLMEKFKGSCLIIPDFISMSEENSLLQEIEPHMKRLRYETEHWDGQIYLYREREQQTWNEKNQKIIKRVADASFSGSDLLSPYIHILDLHQDGYISPHVDSLRYCGRRISGLSLLSDSVMRLGHSQDGLTVDLLLPRRSLYLLSEIGRYEFTHAILKDEESTFKDVRVPRNRRISLILREFPSRNKSDDTN